MTSGCLYNKIMLSVRRHIKTHSYYNYSNLLTYVENTILYTTRCTYTVVVLISQQTASEMRQRKPIFYVVGECTIIYTLPVPGAHELLKLTEYSATSV